MGSISERLRKAVDFLEENGYAKNDSAVAKRLGVTRSTLSMVTNGIRTPSWELLFKLCDIYPISTQWLRTGKGDMIKEDREIELLKKIERLERRIKELEGKDAL